MSNFAGNEDEKYDEVFMQIAGQIGSVQGLLDKFFGFMHRKTDFYVEYEASDSSAKMGFPIGIPEKMVLNSFKKHKMKDYKVEMEGMSDQRSNDRSNSNNNSASSNNSNNKSNSNSSSSGSSSSSNRFSEATHKAEGTPAVTEESRSVSAASSSIKSIDLNAQGQQIPIGNGGVADIYYWTQTLTEITVYVDVDSTSRGRDIECVINPRNFKLSVLGVVLIEGDFEEAVRVDESMWTLNIGDQSGYKRENSEIVIILEKTRKTWWKHVIVGHPEIDTSKVDSSQRIDEYDQSTQAALRKILFDQKQKALGLMTSEEMEKEEILSKARHLPGSPFL